jgi:DNA-binding winged helix-turn-helix (wHTH) protein/tetratricopeptide (TPR) repeat protein
MLKRTPPIGRPPVIELAHQPDFQLASLTVKPSTREIVRPDGSRDVLEPRVMQVLVALHLANPDVVSRDDLVAQCWDGRVVGDDAINGAIGKLRRQSFVIETIPRVGYRLVAPQQSEHAAVSHQDHQPPSRSDRRVLLAGGVALGVAAVAGGGWWLTRRTPPPTPASGTPDVASLIARANATMRRGRLENDAEAAALFQQAVDLAPDNADAWGGLSLAHQFLARNGTRERYQAERLRAEAALDKALALDPRNAFALHSKAALNDMIRGGFLECEQAYRRGLAFHPDNNDLLLGLTESMAGMGRLREAASLMDRALAAASGKLDQAMAWISINSYTGARRFLDADRVAAQGMAQFPRHPLTWLNRLYLLMFTGRAGEALDTLRDVSNRPDEVPAEEVDGMIAVAISLVTNAPRDIDKAAAAELALAYKNTSPDGRAKGLPATRTAENAMTFLSAMGRVDDAFGVARDIYYAPDFGVPPVRYSSNLFQPATRAMRKDPRFAGLMEQLGLTAYWQKAGVKPDYQIYPDG